MVLKFAVYGLELSIHNKHLNWNQLSRSSVKKQTDWLIDWLID